MESQPLLESYLKELRLPAFLKHYRSFGEDAAQAQQSYDRYLLALAEQEVAQRELGKTHVAIGLALTACRQGQRVRFYNAAALVNELLQAQEERRLPKLLNHTLKQQVVVLDELGFIPFPTTGAHLMFQFCATLYDRVALIVTTNLRFAEWTQVLGDERVTAALLDRLTHKAHILEFSGAESYRFRQRLQRQQGDA